MAYSELDGVNRILQLTGEAPVTSLVSPQSPSVAAARAALDYARKTVCAEGEFWNIEPRTVTPDTSGEVWLDDVIDVLPYEPTQEHIFTMRGRQLWDAVNNTGTLSGYGTSFTVRVITLRTFDTMPQPVQAYVIASAADTVAAGLADQAQMTVTGQELSRARVMYKKFLLPPGRYGMLDKFNLSYYTRLGRR